MNRHESLGPEWARHILHHIVYIFELFGHIIWKLYFELLLNTHQKLHCIQLVQPQLVPLTIQCDFFRVIYFIVLGNYSHHPSGGFVGVQVVPWVILILPLASSLILICVLSISWCPPPKPNMGCTNNLLNAVIFLLFLKMFIIDTDLLYIIIKLNYDSNPRSKGGVQRHKNHSQESIMSSSSSVFLTTKFFSFAKCRNVIKALAGLMLLSISLILSYRDSFIS